MKKIKVCKKKYVVEENCPNCKGKGYIEKEIFDDYTQENKKLAYICPQCDNAKKIKKEEGERYEKEYVEVVGNCYFENGENYVIEEAEGDHPSLNTIFLENGTAFRLEKFPENTYFDTDEEAEEYIENLNKEIDG